VRRPRIPAPRRTVAQRFETFLSRIERRERRGPIMAVLLALRFYCDPEARVLRWTGP
jgi:hypothetical protein